MRRKIALERPKYRIAIRWRLKSGGYCPWLAIDLAWTDAERDELVRSYKGWAPVQVMVEAV